MSHTGWMVYDTDKVLILGLAARNGVDIRDLPCPVCGRKSLRRYSYLSQRPGRSVEISYTWCPLCHHYAGSTGPVTPESMKDPLNESEHRDLDHDLNSLLSRLEELWAAGAIG